MSNKRKSTVQLVSPEQQFREEQLSAGLCSAEREAAVHILSHDQTPTGLFNVLNNATGFAEAMAAKFRHPRTSKVDCVAGCSWCCYQTVPVTPPEAFAIADFIRSTGPAHLMDESMARLSDAISRTESLTPRERTKQHIACAFLNGNNCSIYPVRPLACSEFTSMDVNDCKRAYRVGFKPKGIIHEKARMLAFYAVRQGLLEGLSEALPTHSVEHYELAAAVVAAMPKGSAESWLGGHSIFERARLTLDPTAVSEQPNGGDQIDEC